MSNKEFRTMKLPRLDAAQRMLLMRQGVLLAGLLLLAGCAESDSPPTIGPAPRPVPQPETSAVTLEVQTPEETDKLIASHTEKIVVVDLWTLW
jgi:uncharacterized lipoprotein YajG